jgi:thiol-disulfide isomerase/thioredoxin
MKILFVSVVGLLAILFATTDLFAQIETNLAVTKEGLAETNTNSLAWRDNHLMEIARSNAPDSMDKLAEGGLALIKDYPKVANGYEDVMWAAEAFEFGGQPDKARALANELMTNSTLEDYKFWSKGFLNRLGSLGKPISLSFTAVDGREVDLTKLKGKVVLVDFWATTCGPCVKELPRVKAAYDKFQSQGFEVVGISCDTDKERLNKYLKEKEILWPQYFDGKGFYNKISQNFGIDGIPHMLLMDKKGLLRFDNVRASDKFHAKGDTNSFEEKISVLLLE